MPVFEKTASCFSHTSTAFLDRSSPYLKNMMGTALSLGCSEDIRGKCFTDGYELQQNSVLTILSCDCGSGSSGKELGGLG